MESEKETADKLNRALKNYFLAPSDETGLQVAAATAAARASAVMVATGDRETARAAGLSAGRILLRMFARNQTRKRKSA